MPKANIKVKRVYTEPEEDDGFRILVDRLWPRGISKEKGKIDLWLKDIAPSNELRKSYCHIPERWPEFRKKYGEEIRANPSALSTLREHLAQHRTITFLYAAADEEQNNAVALRDVLQKLKPAPLKKK